MGWVPGDFVEMRPTAAERRSRSVAERSLPPSPTYFFFIFRSLRWTSRVVRFGAVFVAIVFRFAAARSLPACLPPTCVESSAGWLADLTYQYGLVSFLAWLLRCPSAGRRVPPHHTTSHHIADRPAGRGRPVGRGPPGHRRGIEGRAGRRRWLLLLLPRGQGPGKASRAAGVPRRHRRTPAETRWVHATRFSRWWGFAFPRLLSPRKPSTPRLLCTRSCQPSASLAPAPFLLVHVMFFRARLPASFDAMRARLVSRV